MYGSIYHHMGALLPNNDTARLVYAQLYKLHWMLAWDKTFFLTL
jgi:hypothetical protein